MEKSKITLKGGSFDRRIVPSERIKKDHNKIQEFLNLIIAEKKPYSLSEIANLMKCDRKLLTQMYSNECEQIKTSYLDSLESKKQSKSKNMKKSIDNAVYTLMKRGIYPTRGRIEGVVGIGVLRERKYRRYWEVKKNNLLMNYNNQLKLK